MKNKQYRLIVAAALLLFAVTGSKAQQAQSVSAPRTLSYQGILTSTGTPGNILGANRLLTVTLYGDANGTIKLWQSTMNTPIDSNGVFNCTLGTADNPLPQPSAMDRAIWLGVAIDNGTELRPLSQVTASAYAINVADSAITSQKIASGAVGTQNLADGSITTSKLADSSITPEKMNMDYVSSISVNGQLITGAGTNLNIVSGDGVNATWIPDQSTLTLSGTGGASDGKTMAVGDPWLEGGNGDITDPTLLFLGTTTDAQVWIKVDGVATAGSTAGTAMRFIPEPNTPNIIGGDVTNIVDNSDLGGSSTGSGIHNTVKSVYSGLGSGNSNIIDTLADESFLGSGMNNAIGTYGHGFPVGDTVVFGAEFIGAGMDDSVKSALSAIMSGVSNTVDTFAENSFIVGGSHNNIIGTGVSLIVGGNTNLAKGFGGYIVAGTGNVVDTGGTIVAGYHNSSAAQWADIGGGNQNVVTTNGGSGFIGGGTYNFTNAHQTFVGAGFSDSINALASGAVAGGNATIDSGSFYSIVGAGTYNFIDTVSPSSSIIAGDSNTIGGIENFIGAGDLNAIGVQPEYHGDLAGDFVPSNYSFIGSGMYNFISGSNGSSIVGGSNNEIGIYGDPSTYSVISGGDSNSIDFSTNGVIGGGGFNDVHESPYSSIGGGYENSAHTANYASIGGGLFNRVWARYYGTISGGDSNFIQEPYGTISGGVKNNVYNDYGTIGGGWTNYVYSAFGTIGGGGDYNLAGSPSIVDSFTVIAGGEHNQVAQNWSAITGGVNNGAYDTASFVGGGSGNLTQQEYSTIGGGHNNSIGNYWLGWDARGSTIGGGDTNVIYPYCTDGFLGGGRDNAIVGGIIDEFNHFPPTPFATIGGGILDTIYSGDTSAFIAGGDHNVIDTLSPYSTIGGGRTNYIAKRNLCATIPGGDSLTAQSYAQVVMGYNNIPAGNFTKGTTHVFTTGGVQDQSLLILGNGNIGQHSDAFQVSYDGHSTVFDINGNTNDAGRQPVYGSTYQDNTIIAWGDINKDGSIVADYGVDRVLESTTAPGTYLVFLHNQNNVVLNHATITVTLRNNDTTGLGGFDTLIMLKPGAPLDNTGCGGVDATELNILSIPNAFIVHTRFGTATSCEIVEHPFFFKVCARPLGTGF